MKLTTLTTLLTLGAAALGVTARGQSTLITFDDLNATTAGIPIYNGYGGLNWNNFYALDGVHYGASGYQNGVITPNGVAYNGYGNTAEITSGSTFTLGGGYFTAAWQNFNLEVQGYNGASLVYDQTFSLNTISPQYLVFNYANITDARFLTGGTWLAMDNLTIGVVAPVPEPSTLALAGLGGLSLLVLRKRR